MLHFQQHRCQPVLNEQTSLGEHAGNTHLATLQIETRSIWQAVVSKAKKKKIYDKERAEWGWSREVWRIPHDALRHSCYHASASPAQEIGHFFCPLIMAALTNPPRPPQEIDVYRREGDAQSNGRKDKMYGVMGGSFPSGGRSGRRCDKWGPCSHTRARSFSCSPSECSSYPVFYTLVLKKTTKCFSFIH